MHEQSTANSAEPSITTLKDGSVRVTTQDFDFALHIALGRSASRRSHVAITLAFPPGSGPLQLWEFPVILEGHRVRVGDAVATAGEAPLLRNNDSKPELPLRIDRAFTRAFRVFSTVNRDRMVWAAITSGAGPSSSAARAGARS